MQSYGWAKDVIDSLNSLSSFLHGWHMGRRAQQNLPIQIDIQPKPWNNIVALPNIAIHYLSASGVKL